jgi:hypothetical protein
MLLWEGNRDFGTLLSDNYAAIGGNRDLGTLLSATR